MTDLIASLADQIIALINAKPSSPTKEEIETAFRKVVGDVEAPQVIVNWAWLKITLNRAGMGRPPELAKMAGETPLCHAAWEDGPDPACRACGTPYSQWAHIHCDEALAAKQVHAFDPTGGDEAGVEIRPARPSTDTINAVQRFWELALDGPTPVLNAEKVKAYAIEIGVCLGYSSGIHHWEVDPFTSGEAASKPGNLCVCGAIKPTEDSVEIRAMAALASDMVASLDADTKLRDEWDKAERDAHKALGYEGPTTMERIAQARELIAAERATYASQPCLGSTDGKHAFYYDITMDEHRCACGAKARL